MLTFQQLILRLNDFWDRRGCALLQPYDMEMGAGTFHTATFLRAIGPEPWNAAYVQPSRRPKDGRYGDNPNRLQHYYQYQVALKPSPPDIQDLYLESLKNLGINPQEHDIRFVEDDWESPTLGAWGLGWEVWLNGMEVTQFTYFQEVGCLPCKPVLGKSPTASSASPCTCRARTRSTTWSGRPGVTYGDVYHQNEVEQSRYNFELSNVEHAVPTFRRTSNEKQNASSRRSACCPPTRWCSRARTPSTCSMRAAPSPSPSAPPTSVACARWPAPSPRPTTNRASGSAFRW